MLMAPAGRIACEPCPGPVMFGASAFETIVANMLETPFRLIHCKATQQTMLHTRKPNHLTSWVGGHGLRQARVQCREREFQIKLTQNGRILEHTDR